MCQKRGYQDSKFPTEGKARFHFLKTTHEESKQFCMILKISTLTANGDGVSLVGGLMKMFQN